MEYSVFMLEPGYGWIAVHRLPEDSAIHYAKAYRLQRLDYDARVALVPDAQDPEPYLSFVLEYYLEPRYGHCDTCGSTCDHSGCLVDRRHAAALA